MVNIIKPLVSLPSPNPLLCAPLLSGKRALLILLNNLFFLNWYCLDLNLEILWPGCLYWEREAQINLILTEAHKTLHHNKLAISGVICHKNNSLCYSNTNPAMCLQQKRSIINETSNILHKANSVSCFFVCYSEEIK